ncbi:hypothetical protein SprV_0301076900 [Sparganum proliferum]
MQYQVFKLEQRPDWEDYGDGSNNPILNNPLPRPEDLDFLQYIFVAMQYQVFKLEQRPDWEDYGDGSNNPILNNPLPRPEDRDFISTKE